MVTGSGEAWEEKPAKAFQKAYYPHQFSQISMINLSLVVKISVRKL